MAFSTNDLKNGMTLELNDGLFSVVEFQHVKPGKGGAFVRTKLRNVKTKAVVEKTFRADEKVEQAIIDKREMQYLYRDGADYVFMDNASYDQRNVPAASLGEASKYLKEGDSAVLEMYQDEIIDVDLPAAVELTVSETEPGLQGDHVQGGRKAATTETGLVVQVPLFVNTGDRIKVDTRSGDYLARYKPANSLRAVGERRRSRERALGLLYEAELKSTTPDAILAALAIAPEPYATELVAGVGQHIAEIDAAITAHADDWAIDRMPSIDRALLRVAAFELIASPTVPVAVVIDEAVELAKQYSTEDSSRFVNGVLSAIARDMHRERNAFMSESSNPYEATGVDYTVLDAAKRTAQKAALSTSPFPHRLGAVVDDASRGEPATVVRLGDQTLGFVLECLGTKSMLASAYEASSGIDRFDAIGYDTVASAVNDCCCVGALPFVVNAYFATGSAAFYQGPRHASLVAGFARGCADAGAAWGGGESPTLSGLVFDSEIDLAASAVGLVPEGAPPLLGTELRDGDAIVFIASSGLHANGASLVRAIAPQLPDGLSTRLPSGRPFGHAVLDETIIYVPLVEAILKAQLPLHYVSHITGHGLRKVMRADREFTYRVEALPAVPEALAFLVEHAAMSPRDAYGTLNMGAGFALYVEGSAAAAIVELASDLGYEATIAGKVEAGPRRVILEPIAETFEGFELELR